MAFTWSAQQEAIFSWAAEPQEVIRSLVIRARAGTGKSTTIAEMVKRMPEASILVCSFSKDIEVAMNEKLKDTKAIAKTFHAIGRACVVRFRDRINFDFKSDRADTLAKQACGKTAPDTIVRLVSKLMTKGRLMAPHATQFGELTAIQVEFELEPEAQWTSAGYDAAYVENKALQAMELAADVQSGATCDGTDMIFLPLRNGWLAKMYDAVLVDEAQDMTLAQLEMAEGVLKPGGRIIIVGDDRQAIYSFMGADSGSIDRLKVKLNAQELGLKTTYRCGRAIVEQARHIVTDFEAGEGNHEGSVTYLDKSKLVTAAGPGDFILSRVNAPLVSIAMQLLRSGKRARVAGRNIGEGLQAIVRRLKARSVPDFMAKVSSWEDRELGKLETLRVKATNGKRTSIEAKMDAISDQAAMLLTIADGATSITAVEDRIEALFTDDGKGIAGMTTCSSIHKAKGLEADRVFILAKTLSLKRFSSDDSNDARVMARIREEQNIKYVAITRAKKELVWVTEPAQ